jgi:hypothetical protein
VGLIRKTMSASTFGGVKYTSRREAQTKLALEQAKLLRQQRKDATPRPQQRNETSAPRREFDEELPAWRQPTLGSMLRKIAAGRSRGSQ